MNKKIDLKTTSFKGWLVNLAIIGAYIFIGITLFIVVSLCLSGCNITEPVTKITYRNGSVTVPAEAYIWTSWKLNPQYEYRDLIFVVDQRDTLKNFLSANVDEPSVIPVGCKVETIDVFAKVFDTGEDNTDYWRPIGFKNLFIMRLDSLQCE